MERSLCIEYQVPLELKQVNVGGLKKSKMGWCIGGLHCMRIREDGGGTQAHLEL